MLEFMGDLYHYRPSFRLGCHVLAAWIVLEAFHLLAGSHVGTPRAFSTAAPPPAAGQIAPPPAPAPPAGRLRSGLLAQVFDPAGKTRYCAFYVRSFPLNWKTWPGPDSCSMPKGTRFRLLISGLVRVKADGPASVWLGNTNGATQAALGETLLFAIDPPAKGTGPVRARRRDAWLQAGWITLSLDYAGTSGFPGAVDLDITKDGGTARTLTPADFARDAG